MNKQIPFSTEDTTDQYDYLANAASTQDCTGLIPGNPLPIDFEESYGEVYHYEPPKISPHQD